MAFVRILIIMLPPHRGVYPLVDHTLVVDHTLEPSVNNRSTWCHRSVWGGEFGGRALTVLDNRLPEVIWLESGRGDQQSNHKGRGGIERTVLPYASFPGASFQTLSSSAWLVAGCPPKGSLQAHERGQSFPYPTERTDYNARR